MNALPEATLARLASYLPALDRLHAEGRETVASGDLAAECGVNPAQLRKDLSLLGSYGTRGVGYEVAYLHDQINRELGGASHWQLIIVGIGNLGRALATHTPMAVRGFGVIGLFDAAPEVIGTRVEGLEVRPMAELRQVVTDPARTIAVVATPGAATQSVIDELADAGIRSVLNFSPGRVVAPPEMLVRAVDLGSELQILAYHRQMLSTPAADTVAN